GDTFTFRGVTPAQGANYRALVGTVDVARGGRWIDPLHPEKRDYLASGQTMTEAAIDAGIFGDRYVSLGEPVSDKGAEGAWALRLYIKPFVDWIGFCCFM